MTKQIYFSYAWWEWVLMKLIVLIFAKIGQQLVLLFSGYKFFKWRLPNCLGPIKIPPLIGGFFGGMIARNLHDWTYNAYNENWAAFARNYPLLLIIAMGGIEI